MLEAPIAHSRTVGASHLGRCAFASVSDRELRRFEPEG
jgi:hypothetical protein